MITIKRPSLKRPSSPRGSTPLVGLEIEPGAVHAAQVKVNGVLSIERAGSVALDPGVVRDGEIVDLDALAASMKDLFAEHRLGKRVRVGVANQRAVVRHLMLPPIEDAKELATAVRFLAESELPMPLDQAVLEHVSLGVVDTPAGPRQRVLVVAARRDMIDRMLVAVRQAGLRPEGIDLSAFGMIRALPADPGRLVVHLSVGGLVNLALSRSGECLFTRVVGQGLETMATELAERRGITVTDARQALLEIGLPEREPEPEPDPVALAVAEAEESVYGPSPEPVVAAPAPAPAEPTLADVCQTIVGDGVRRIATEVRNSIDFHLSGPSDQGRPAVEAVLLTGKAVAVPGFASALQNQLGLPVEIRDVAGADPAAQGSHAVAAGLAIEEAVA